MKRKKRDRKRKKKKKLKKPKKSKNMAVTEIISKRGYASKVLSDNTKPNNEFIAKIHCGHVHYKDSSGKFQDIDISIEDMGTYWRMTKASYRLYIAKNFGDAQLIRFDNRYEGANHSIYYEPHSLQWVHKTSHDRILIKAAQNVTGVVSGHMITYANAFGNNIDFVIELRNNSFKKYIRFNTKPTLSPPSADYVPVLLVKYTGSGLTVKAKDLTDWDGDSYYESDDGFEISEVSPKYKSYIRKAYIEDMNGSRQKVKLFWEKLNSVLWQAKVLPKTFLANAVYPVIADAVTAPTSSAGDGYLGNFDNANPSYWDFVHDGAVADEVQDGLLNMTTLGESNSDATFAEIAACFIMFDTGAVLEANANISAATLTLYCISKVNNDNDGDDFLAIVQGNQATWDTLVVGDWDERGESLANGWSDAKQTDIIEGATRIDIGNITAADDNVFTLDGTGRGWVARNGETIPAGASAAGKTQLVVRDGHDLIDALPTARNKVFFQTSEHDNDPVLTVTYTIPGNAGIMTTNTGFWGVTY